MISVHAIPLEENHPLDDARSAALGRFAADVARLGGDTVLVGTYRAALIRAGRSSDRAWHRFARALRRFIADTSPATREQQDAAVRLHAILAENADLLSPQIR